MSVYAVISEQKVVNIIIWNGDESTWSSPEGCSTLGLSDGEPCGVGWVVSDGKFVVPEFPAANDP
ncbi:hypothetical protein [Burkholderia sp. TSV86]|uniref:hypothetical protein n=1 Tax=Burkholderia sp. TSV86 TaxID=1385594 RepID=UPI000B03B738|nr:hypothetical protein [Burkholderia sp. TSV86]